MASLFISHSSLDAPSVTRITRWLKQRGARALFLDLDPELGIPPGADWERELYTKLRAADGVLFIGGPHALESKWCFAELAMARSLGKKIIPVKVAGGGDHPLLLPRAQSIDFSTRSRAAYRLLAEQLHAAELDPTRLFDWDHHRSPYPGLRSFDEGDAAMFFGRSSEVEALLEVLQSSRRQYGGRVVAVSGPSGAGKSSLVLAGLVPWLRHDKAWLVLPSFTPGSEPLTRLARALASDRTEHEGLEESLRRRGDALRQRVDELAGMTGARIHGALLIIDQAEELVTRSVSDDARAVLALLHDATKSDGLLWVILTMRSEFLTTPLLFDAGAPLIDETILVGPLGRERLGDVIAQPAARASLSLDDGLVERMVEDTGGGDALPLLAYTLRRLSERAGREGTLTLADYKNIGGVVGALRTAADDVLSRLGDVVVATLLKLVTVNAEGATARRGVPRKAFTSGEKAVLDAFIDARLLLTDGAGGAAMVSVAHEALLRQWQPLADAIEEHRGELRMAADLEARARDWEGAGHPASDLLVGDRLTAARRWQQSPLAVGPDMSLVSDFIARSLAHDRETRDRAREMIAHRVLDGFPDDPELGVLLAIAAIREYGASPLAVLALQRAVDAWPVVQVVHHEAPVSHVEWAADGVELVTACADGTVGLPHGESRITVSHDGAVTSMCRLDIPEPPLPPGAPYERRLPRPCVAVGFDTGHAEVWELAGGGSVKTLCLDAPVVDLAWDPTGGWLASASTNGTLLFWNPRSDEVTRVTQDAPVTGISWSADGQRLASGAADCVARVWNPARAELVGRLPHPASVEIVSWSSATGGARCLATASADHAVRVWGEVRDLRGPPRPMLEWCRKVRPRAIAWSPADESLLVGYEDGIACAYAIRSAAEHGSHELLHGSAVHHVGWLGERGAIATACQDGSVRVWNASGSQIMMLRHADRVTSMRLSPRQVATASHDGDAVASSVVGDACTLVGDGEILELVWEPDAGRALGIAHDGGPTKIWRHGTDAATEITTVPSRALTWSSDGELLGMIDASGQVGVWDQRGQAVVRNTWQASGTKTTFPRTRAGQDIRASQIWASKSTSRVQTASSAGTIQAASSAGTIAWSPRGRRLASAPHDGPPQVTDPDSKEPVVLPQDGSVRALLWEAGGQALAMVGHDGGIRLWSEALGLKKLGGNHRAACWAPASEYLAAAGSDGRTRVWDLSGRPVAELAGSSATAWAPSGRSLAIVDDTRVSVVAVPSAEQLVSWTGAAVVHTVAWSSEEELTALDDAGQVAVWAHDARSDLSMPSRIRDVVWAPNGGLIAATAYDGSLLIWDARGGDQKEIAAPRGAVRLVMWSSNGKLLLALLHDGRVDLWDISSGERELRFDDLADVTLASWAPGVPRLALAMRDGTTRVEEVVDRQTLLESAEHRVFRDLTPVERARFGLPG